MTDIRSNSSYLLYYRKTYFTTVEHKQGLIISLSLKTLILSLSSIVYLTEKTRLSKLPQVTVVKIVNFSSGTSRTQITGCITGSMNNRKRSIYTKYQSFHFRILFYLFFGYSTHSRYVAKTQICPFARGVRAGPCYPYISGYSLGRLAV